MCPTLPRRWFPTLALLALCGCKSASELREPEATDPLGYEDHLAQAGTDEEIYWGPKQNLLFREYKTLQEAHVQLGKRLDQVLVENQNLKTQLDRDGSSLQQERTLRAQAEAETGLLRQRGRELEARSLGLSIEKAKLEQQILQAKIDALRQLLGQDGPAAAEAAPAPPRSR